MRLSVRLQTVASYVRKGSRVADVGTDHGYVPIYLIKEGIAEAALAMDVREGPLERAREHIRSYGLEGRIKTRLSDGLEQLRAGEADTVVIAGMGGELMIHILEEGMHVWETVDHWVLSPQSEIDKVRRYLEQNSFSLLDETMLVEEGKYYTVMSAGRNMTADETAGGAASPEGKRQAEDEKQGTDMGESDYLYGRRLIEKKSPVLKEYLEKEKKTLKGILGQVTGQDSDGARRRQNEILKEISQIEEVEDEMR